MTLHVVTSPAVEPLTVRECMAIARFTTSNQEPPAPAPTAAMASPAAPGLIENGDHRYLVTFVTADGETQAGQSTAAVMVANRLVNGQIQLTEIPLGGAAVTARKLYRTMAGGSIYLLLTTLADNTTTTYTDNVADASLGVGAPALNTTTDPIVQLMIQAARTVAEERTGRKLITQTLDLILDAFPEQEIKLGIMPIQSITHVQYVDPDEVVQTISPSAYTLDQYTLPGWLLPAYGEEWPSTLDAAQVVTVRMVAGYGATGALVDSRYRQWIAAQVKASLDNPDGLIIGTIVQPLPYFDHLLDQLDIRDCA